MRNFYFVSRQKIVNASITEMIVMRYKRSNESNKWENSEKIEKLIRHEEVKQKRLSERKKKFCVCCCYKLFNRQRLRTYFLFVRDFGRDWLSFADIFLLWIFSAFYWILRIELLDNFVDYCDCTKKYWIKNFYENWNLLKSLKIQKYYTKYIKYWKI
jgi:hypothetical protein